MKGKREGREREGKGRWVWDPSTRDRNGEEEKGGKDGTGGEGKEGEVRKRK